MSNRQERRHSRRHGGSRRAATTERHADSDYGVIVGWCAGEEDLAEARQLTHDAVIRTMGARRTGGVRWLWSTGDEALALLGQIRLDSDPPELAEHYRQIGERLADRGGYIVVAMAEGRRA